MSLEPHFSFASGFTSPEPSLRIWCMLGAGSTHSWLRGGAPHTTGTHVLWANLSELRTEGCVLLGFWNGPEHSLSAILPPSHGAATCFSLHQREMIKRHTCGGCGAMKSAVKRRHPRLRSHTPELPLAKFAAGRFIKRSFLF